MAVARAQARDVKAYPPEAVLTIQQVAQGLQLSVRSVERLNLPCIHLGRLRRFVWRQVLAHIEGKAA